MTALRVTLEWFLNPDHLPMIAGIVSGRYQQAGLAVELIEPSEHYDGFAALQRGEIELHSNEPIHLFEHYSDDILALGCFFATRGGVLMRQSSMDKFARGQAIRICTPAAEPKTNRIGFEILSRYAHAQGMLLDEGQVAFVQADFHHIANLQNDPTLDGAWLCFYNFEGIEATHADFEFVFIDEQNAHYPNFSALELLTSRQVMAQKGEAIRQFLAITSEMTALCQQNPTLAKQYYYQYSKTQPEPLMDAIIEDTLPRLITPIRPDASRWQRLREMLEQLDIAKLDDDAYQRLWA